MQTLGPLSSGKKPGPWAVIQYSVRQSGFASLYTGLSASLLRQMSYSLVRIGSYEEMKRRLSENEKPTTGSLLVAASLAGGLGGIVGNPAGP